MNSKSSITIILPTDSKTAKTFRALSEPDKKRHELILYLKLKDTLKQLRPLDEIINEMSIEAIRNGLTPGTLELIINES